VDALCERVDDLVRGLQFHGVLSWSKWRDVRSVCLYSYLQRARL
jgi:hypothetical protein